MRTKATPRTYVEFGHRMNLHYRGRNSQVSKPTQRIASTRAAMGAAY